MSAANNLDGTITDGGELTHSYAAEGEVKMTKQEIIETVELAGFEAVERVRFISRNTFVVSAEFFFDKPRNERIVVVNVD